MVGHKRTNRPVSFDRVVSFSASPLTHKLSTWEERMCLEGKGTCVSWEVGSMLHT